MNQYELIFPLTYTAKVVIPFENPLASVDWYNEEPILFSNDNGIIPLNCGSTYFNIRDLQNYLSKALNNNLILHQSITSDIGYLLNEYYRNIQLHEPTKQGVKHLPNAYRKNDEGFVIEHFENGFIGWVGCKYELWYDYDNEKAYMTWLYNDYDRNIIFEITPVYPYFVCEKKKQKNYVPYEQWLKTYEPYFTAQLSRKTAQQWLEQASYIVKTIDDNIARWKKEYEGRKTNNDESI